MAAGSMFGFFPKLSPDAQGATIQGGLGLLSGLLSGVGQGQQNDKTLAANKQGTLVDALLKLQQNELGNPYARLHQQQQQDFRGTMIGGGAQPFDPSTGMGGYQAPQAGQLNQSLYGQGAMADAKSQFDSQNMHNRQDVMNALGIGPDGQPVQQAHAKGSGFWHKFAQIAGMAAPIIAAPFTGGASLALIGAGAGAAGAWGSGAGAKGILGGAAMGSIPGLTKAGPDGQASLIGKLMGHGGNIGVHPYPLGPGQNPIPSSALMDVPGVNSSFNLSVNNPTSSWNIPPSAGAPPMVGPDLTIGGHLPFGSVPPMTSNPPAPSARPGAAPMTQLGMTPADDMRYGSTNPAVLPYRGPSAGPDMTLGGHLPFGSVPPMGGQSYTPDLLLGGAGAKIGAASPYANTPVMDALRKATGISANGRDVAQELPGWDRLMPVQGPPANLAWPGPLGGTHAHMGAAPPQSPGGIGQMGLGLDPWSWQQMLYGKR